MHFDDAIRAHVEWKFKLTRYIANPDKSLDATVVEKDNQCELGKWLYSPAASKYEQSPLFAELKKKHATFHCCAVGLIRRADSGEKVSVESAISPKSDYGKISTEVVALIMKLKRDLE